MQHGQRCPVAGTVAHVTRRWCGNELRERPLSARQPAHALTIRSEPAGRKNGPTSRAARASELEGWATPPTPDGRQLKAAGPPHQPQTSDARQLKSPHARRQTRGTGINREGREGREGNPNDRVVLARGRDSWERPRDAHASRGRPFTIPARCEPRASRSAVPSRPSRLVWCLSVRSVSGRVPASPSVP